MTVATAHSTVRSAARERGNRGPARTIRDSLGRAGRSGRGYQRVHARARRWVARARSPSRNRTVRARDPSVTWAVMFQPVGTSLDLVELEERVLERWRED